MLGARFVSAILLGDDTEFTLALSRQEHYLYSKAADSRVHSSLIDLLFQIA